MSRMRSDKLDSALRSLEEAARIIREESSRRKDEDARFLGSAGVSRAVSWVEETFGLGGDNSVGMIASFLIDTEESADDLGAEYALYYRCVKAAMRALPDGHRTRQNRQKIERWISVAFTHIALINLLESRHLAISVDTQNELRFRLVEPKAVRE